MILLSFRAVPGEGHSHISTRLYSYIFKMRHTIIGVRTDEPDFADLPEDQNTWNMSIHGNIKEEISQGFSKTIEKFVRTTHYIYINLHYAMMTWRSIVSILYLINTTSFDWYSKR